MIEDLTNVAVGGILALLILREVFNFVARLKANRINGIGGTHSIPNPAATNAVLARLDRIIERLDDIAEATRAARKQSEISGEQSERMIRAVYHLETTINENVVKRLPTQLATP